jgi:hypothetical protein
MNDRLWHIAASVIGPLPIADPPRTLAAQMVSE